MIGAHQYRDGRETGMAFACWLWMMNAYRIGAIELADYFADEHEYWLAASPRSAIL